MEKIDGYEQIIRWADYPKKETSPNGSLAETYSGFSLSEDHKTVSVVFDTTKSWVVQEAVKGAEGKKLLIHEQGHFRISAIAGQQLQNEINALKNERSFKRDASEALHAIKRKEDIIQRKYEKETEQSMNEVAQSRWNTKIDGAFRAPSPNLSML